MEGYFSNGLLKGYGRKLDSKGECKVGYWDILNERINIPSGKWTWYLKDGRFKVPDTYYIGKLDLSQIVLKSITPKDKKIPLVFDSFEENINMSKPYSV